MNARDSFFESLSRWLGGRGEQPPVAASGRRRGEPLLSVRVGPDGTMTASGVLAGRGDDLVRLLAHAPASPPAKLAAAKNVKEMPTACTNCAHKEAHHPLGNGCIHCACSKFVAPQRIARPPLDAPRLSMLRDIERLAGIAARPPSRSEPADPGLLSQREVDQIVASVKSRQAASKRRRNGGARRR